jgi:tryptophanyl-tRNA synthetase
MLTPIKAPAKRVMSLQRPLHKMSKSDPDPRSRILFTDTSSEMRKKVMSSLTDSTNAVSYDPVNRPAVSNLLELLSHFDSRGRSPAELAAPDGDLAGAPLKELKTRVADAVEAELAGVRERFLAFLAKKDYLDRVIEEGGEKARQNAEETMKDVRSVVELGA